MGEDARRMLIAVSLSFVLMFCWQYFFPNKALPVQKSVQSIVSSQNVQSYIQPNQGTFVRIEHQNIPKVNIETPSLKGSISTLGLRIENLFLLKHKDRVGLNAQPIKLFSDNSQFVDVKFWSFALFEELPSSNTLWNARGKNLTVETPVEFDWTNSQGVKFLVQVSLDKNYL